MDKTTISTTLKAYVIENFLYDDETAILEDEALLFEQGIIDSMGIFRIIGFIEETFETKVAPDEIVLENFETVAAITTLVHAHLNVETLS